jgi:hypothetical protein
MHDCFITVILALHLEFLDTTLNSPMWFVQPYGYVDEADPRQLPIIATSTSLVHTGPFFNL